MLDYAIQTANIVDLVSYLGNLVRAVEIPCPTCPTGTFHSGQVENLYLLVLGQVQMHEVNTILYIVFIF